MPTRKSGTSYIKGQANVSETATLDNSLATENCTIDGGIFINSIIKGKTLAACAPYIENSELNCERVTGYVQIHNSYLGECIVARDHAEITNCYLLGTIQIEGNAQLHGIKLIYVSDTNQEMGDNLRIHTGIWQNAPKFIRCGGWTVSECVNGYGHVGCYCRPIGYWLKIGKKFAKRAGWSDEDEQNCRNFFTSL